MAPRGIPNETIDRLFTYFRALTCLRREGSETVSSKRIAEICHVTAAVVRKDFSYFGEFGIRGVGYNVQKLLKNFRRILNFDDSIDVVLVGAGNIGRALLARSGGFEIEGFNISMLFDSDPSKIGKTVGALTVGDIAEMPARVKSAGIDLAILAVPDTAAPEIARTLADAGVSSILSLSPCELCMPETVKVTCIDLSMEMARLMYRSRLHDQAKDLRMRE
ncbi:redox-sensing transcriptional repressor Rex [Candidatus Fermentibacterales bacterium]|nr:redox-sensing transcriptional repressor Rex [Candidatus Fermentibacterales bacterium]